MKYRSFVIIFLIIIASGVGGFIVLRSKLYPVAVVNNSLITAKALDKELRAAIQYYQTAANVYGAGDTPREITEKFFLELRRAALNGLIENRLINNELIERHGSGKDRLISAKMENVLSQVADQAQLKEATQTLYGLEFDDFKALILAPQAGREVLTEQLSAEGQSFKEWLKNAKINARVVLLALGLRWTESGVEMAK